jgi:branched-subunit amino acid aminotransferase/4-amino-4-deoxychorismate lyase
MLTLINGQPADPSVSVFDGAVLRGDGCFEALRSYGGRPFAFAEHHHRLTRSAAALRLPLPAYSDLLDWVERCAEDGGDCVVRILVTRGATGVGADTPPLWVVLWHPLPDPVNDLTLEPVAAPWHPGGESWELAGVKTISYAANQAASRRAQEAGSHDALLISREGEVLEGPTFGIAWLCDGVLETPSLDLGILESITRGFVLEGCQQIGIPVAHGRYPLERLRGAGEVVAFSTVKEVTRVRKVGPWQYEPGPVARELSAFYRSLVQVTPSQTTIGS